MQWPIFIYGSPTRGVSWVANMKKERGKLHKTNLLSAIITPQCIYSRLASLSTDVSINIGFSNLNNEVKILLIPDGKPTTDVTQIEPSIDPSIYGSIDLPIQRSTDQEIYRSSHLTIHRSTDPAICSSIDLPNKRSTYQSIYRSSDLQLQRSIDPSIYRSRHLQIQRSTDPAIYRSSDLPIQRSIDPAIYRSSDI